MEMTFNEYTSKMFSILETAIYNYEIETLVEASDLAVVDNKDAAEKKASRFEAVKKIAKNVWDKIWTAIKNFFSALVRKANELVNAPVVLTKDMQLYPGATKFDSTLMRYASELAAGKVENADEALKYLDNSVNMETVKEGTEINTRNLTAIYKKYLAAIEKCEKTTFNGDNENLKVAQTVLKRIINVLYSYADQADKLMTARTAQVIANKAAKEKAKADKKKEDIKEEVKNESVEADDIALSARLILEAANLLKEDADYVDGIEGGEGTQKEIEDIPEEKPETTGEYPADDITGGEGEKVDQEEIKDLLDDDKEAIAILNDDEGGKAVTESVIITF